MFELSEKDGSWTEQILHSFSPDEGGYSTAAPILDEKGNLYGTTVGQVGTVFELSCVPGDAWTEQILLSYANVSGVSPAASVTIDPEGNLYGTTLPEDPCSLGASCHLGGNLVMTALCARQPSFVRTCGA